jgi:5-formyltetrahydrofolate cyclo-ligase
VTDKSALRARMRAARRRLVPEERARAAGAIHARLRALDLPSPVFLYLSVRDELDTRALLGTWPVVAVPRITGEGRMEAVRWQEPLVDGPFGVPTSLGPVVAPEVIVVPGLAFDDDGGRLGYGGGYYDRWMAAHPEVHRIGVGFACQRVDRVPREPHDVRLHAVLTA